MEQSVTALSAKHGKRQIILRWPFRLNSARAGVNRRNKERVGGNSKTKQKKNNIINKDIHK